jgi:hypothetical protein
MSAAQPSPFKGQKSRRNVKNNEQIEPKKSTFASTTAQTYSFRRAVKPTPKWLKSLIILDRSSSAIAIASIVSTIVIYSAMFGIPKEWTQNYKKLEELQENERELTVINETLKNQFSKDSEQKVYGLSPASANRVFFLPSSSSKMLKNQPLPQSENQNTLPASGY